MTAQITGSFVIVGGGGGLSLSSEHVGPDPAIMGVMDMKDPALSVL